MCEVNLTRLVDAINESFSEQMSEGYNDTALDADELIKQIMEGEDYDF